MNEEPGLIEAAELFKVLGSAARLGLLRRIEEQSRSVSALAEAMGMSQPLTSQHLRSLRQAGLVKTSRSGKEIVYHLADLHVSHVVADALAHVREPRVAETGDLIPSEERA